VVLVTGFYILTPVLSSNVLYFSLVMRVSLQRFVAGRGLSTGGCWFLH